MPVGGVAGPGCRGGTSCNGRQQHIYKFTWPDCSVNCKLLLHFLAAARRRSTRQLYIKGKTPRPNALLVSRNDERRSWLVATIIKYGRRPVVVPVRTPKDRFAYTTWASKEKEGGQAELTGGVYVTVIRKQLRPDYSRTKPAKWPPRDALNLLHDRDPAHTSKKFQKFAATYNINAKLLPPHSPDLDPLDYGVFGPAQQKLDQELERRAMTFDEQCEFLKQAIQAANSDAAIMQLPRRIALCIAAEGWHFEPVAKQRK